MIEDPNENEAQFEEVPCPIGCPPDDEHVLFGVDRLHGLPGEFTVVRCASCGLMRTSPRPIEECIGAYYPPDYGPYQANFITDEKSRSANLIRWLSRFQPHWLRNRRVPVDAGGRLLEIGCGSGRYLLQMREAGWQVKGVEVSPDAATAIRNLGLDVHCGSIMTLPNDWISFDLIVGWMVLEHIYDPVGMLRMLRERVSDEGWLVLAVPDAAGRLGFQLFRSYWYALQLPTHSFHFTPVTLKAVLEMAGWSVEKIYWQYDARNFFWSLSYWCAEHNFGNLTVACEKMARSRANPLMAALAVLFGGLRCSGRMVVWARPIPSNGR